MAFLLGSTLEYNYLVMLQYALQVALVSYEAIICFVTQYRKPLRDRLNSETTYATQSPLVTADTPVKNLETTESQKLIAGCE